MVESVVPVDFDQLVEHMPGKLRLQELDLGFSHHATSLVGVDSDIEACQALNTFGLDAAKNFIQGRGIPLVLH